jgi:hypothetical protein
MVCFQLIKILSKIGYKCFNCNYLDWNFLEIQNRLYFRTIEDNNKNGEFDKTDKVHYQFVNLLNNDWNVESYEPIN